MREVELVPGGANKAVTERNKSQYVKLYATYKMAKSEGMEEGLRACRRGIQEVVPYRVLELLGPEDLELLLCGLPTIKVDEWHASACYTGRLRSGAALDASAPLARWFWEVVEQLGDAERALLLKFATGSASVPSEGFQHLRGLNGEQRFTLMVLSGVCVRAGARVRACLSACIFVRACLCFTLPKEGIHTHTNTHTLTHTLTHPLTHLNAKQMRETSDCQQPARASTRSSCPSTHPSRCWNSGSTWRCITGPRALVSLEDKRRFVLWAR